MQRLPRNKRCRQNGTKILHHNLLETPRLAQVLEWPREHWLRKWTTTQRTFRYRHWQARWTTSPVDDEASVISTSSQGPDRPRAALNAQQVSAHSKMKWKPCKSSSGSWVDQILNLSQSRFSLPALKSIESYPTTLLLVLPEN